MGGEWEGGRETGMNGWMTNGEMEYEPSIITFCAGHEQ